MISPLILCSLLLLAAPPPPAAARPEPMVAVRTGRLVVLGDWTALRAHLDELGQRERIDLG